jgi:hypothetical protein
MIHSACRTISRLALLAIAFTAWEKPFAQLTLHDPEGHEIGLVHE